MLYVISNDTHVKFGISKVNGNRRVGHHVGWWPNAKAHVAINYNANRSMAPRHLENLIKKARGSNKEMLPISELPSLLVIVRQQYASAKRVHTPKPTRTRLRYHSRAKVVAPKPNIHTSTRLRPRDTRGKVAVPTRAR
jgi:hypothetical protein